MNVLVPSVKSPVSPSLESFFAPYREKIIGTNQFLDTPDGKRVPLIYADWTASGRAYDPIEKRLTQDILPFVANTHTETSTTGSAMTFAYHEAQRMIKAHVNANEDDVVITATSGMTRLINKFQRILGVKGNAKGIRPEGVRPVVFITHMEHHSNQTSWLETDVTVEVIQPDSSGLVDLNHLKELLEAYQDRPLKIASVTGASNVTGIITPYREIAQMLHAAGGYCFVDFACSAPYVDIDMHPDEEGAHLDAVLFSPHKFLGGPGSAAVLAFNKELYKRSVPDHPGGGTVDWTNPWGGHKYVDDIEAREDGGTPAFLQTIRTAMCVALKEEMGTSRMLAREHQLLNRLWEQIEHIPNLQILAPAHRDRLAILSFYIHDLHYNLAVRLLNDRFGIQSRGGCSCAGTYGHYLLEVDTELSQKMTTLISHGDYSAKMGWIRISLHPTMTDREIDYIAYSLAQLASNHQTWAKDYEFCASKNVLAHKSAPLDANVRGRVKQALTCSFESLENI